MKRCSSLPRGIACPASWDAPELPISSDSQPRRVGDAVHEAMAQIVREGLREPPDLNALAQNHGVEDLDDLRILTWFGIRTWKRIRHESQLLAVEERLEHADGAVELGGAPDVIAEANSGELLVVDWKGGYIEHDYRHQIMGYLWLAAQKYPHSLFKGVIVWLRSCEIEVFSATRAKLAEWREQLGAAVDSDVYAPGPQCQYCPLAHECAARSALIRSTVMDLAPFTEGTGRITPERIGALYGRAQLLAKALENYNAIVRDTVRTQGSLSTGDGRVLSFRKGEREHFYLDRVAGPLARALELTGVDGLVQALGEDAIKLTKKKIQDLAADGAPKGEKAKRIRKVMDALKSAGAIVTRPTRTFTVKKEKTDG